MRRKQTKRDLLELLKRVEYELRNQPAFNPWDLGPSILLLDVRQALGIPLFREGENRRPLEAKYKEALRESAHCFIGDLKRYVGNFDRVTIGGEPIGQHRIIATHKFLATSRDKPWCHICLKDEGDPIHVSATRKD